MRDIYNKIIKIFILTLWCGTRYFYLDLTISGFHNCGFSGIRFCVEKRLKSLFIILFDIIVVEESWLNDLHLDFYEIDAYFSGR